MGFGISRTRLSVACRNQDGSDKAVRVSGVRR